MVNNEIVSLKFLVSIVNRIIISLIFFNNIGLKIIIFKTIESAAIAYTKYVLCITKYSKSSIIHNI